MPLDSVLADILLHFQAQLHQLTSNAIVQLSKYFWAVGSFGGEPSGNSFAMLYELHYQLKSVETPEGDRIAQYGCMNFHVKRDGSSKLSLAIKNKWSAGVTPRSEKTEQKPLYVYPGCSNHTYSNNMVNRYNISINYKQKSYKMTRGSERRLQLSSGRNLSVDGASTGTTGGEACLASFIFWLLLVPLILTLTFGLT
jgi:hypothetical protein